MTRRKKLIRNTGAAMLYQITTLACGFVLPKFVIPYFGSATNGLISSITQFLTIITLCECGVGAVVQSALYKPLADKDEEELSRIIISSNRFFGMIMRLLYVYVAVLMIVYPVLFHDQFDVLYTSSLVLILALVYIAQYYLFLSYRLLLNAAQASYIQHISHSIALIVNTVATIVLIKLNASVHIVKLVSAGAFLIQPLAIKHFVDRNYHLNLKLSMDREPLEQKWNGLAQHIAVVVRTNTPTVFLTFFSTLESISVYSVYNMVTHGIRQIISSLTTGIQSMLGEMHAKQETEALNHTYDVVELMFHMIVTLMFTVTGVLLIPFIRIYTENFHDANYIMPVLAVLLTFSEAVYCIRMPYDMMIRVAGHYRQTQTSSMIEALINIVVSFVMVWSYGVIGVAIGTVAAVGYRMLYTVYYLSRNVIYRSVGIFVRHIFVDCLCMAAMIFATRGIQLMEVNYFSWFLMAVQTGCVCLAVSLAMNGLLNHRLMKETLRVVRNRKQKK